MRKFKFFIITAVLATLAMLVCGCGGAEVDTGKATNPTQAVSHSATALPDNSVQNTTEAEKTVPEFSLESNDFEIMTVSQTEASDVDIDREDVTLSTEAVAEETAPATEATEETRIELPFVPAE